MILFLLLLATASALQCKSGWTPFGNHCYKHIYDPVNRLTFETANYKCEQLGSRLVDITSLEEHQFVSEMSKMNMGIDDWYNQPVVGVTKVNGRWLWNRGTTEGYLKWCRGEPNNEAGWENCAILAVDKMIRPYNLPEPCLVDQFCHNAAAIAARFSRVICKKEARPACTSSNTEDVGGKCVCKKDFIDITETDVPERRDYKQGEKCIPKDPCRNVKGLTVNYLIDSSKSIGRKNWDSLVDFLRSGAEYLPNTTKVGFVKYSNKVTFSKFLSAGWSKKKFEDFVPSKFDDGGTNTAAAFDKARAMFKDDYNDNQVVVLVTDGLPYIDDTSEKEALAITKKAAKALTSKGVTLIALGYGELTSKNAKTIRSWLKDPQEDYFEYDRLACDLKSVHMCILMRKVCRRFVDY